MLEIDYLIKRDEKDEWVSYTPGEIPTKLSNVTYIKGPNSIGKSTLLNILAVGFFAHKMTHEEINKSLLSDIKGLINKEHQKVKFKIKLSNPNTGVTLISEKPDFETHDVIMKETVNGNERIIDFDEFTKRYRLIYDIPDNPTQRIEKILGNIKVDLSEKARKIKRLERLVRDEKEKVEKAKDPKREEKIREELGTLNKELKDDKELLNRREKLFSMLKKFFYSKFYLKYSDEAEIKRKEKNKLKNEVERKDKRKSVLTEEVQNMLDNVKYYIENIKKNRQEAIKTISKYFEGGINEERLNLWKQRQVKNEIENYSDNNDFRNDLKWLEEKVEGRLDLLFADTRFKEATFIQKFKGFLERFENSEFYIPELEKSVDDYIQTLNQKLENYRSLIEEKENLGSLDELFRAIHDDIKNAIREQKLLDQKIKEDKNLKEELEQNHDFDKLEAKNKILQQVDSQANYYKKKLIEDDTDPDHANEIFKELQNDDELSGYKNQSEEKLNITINKLEEEIDNIKESIKDTKSLINLNEGDLKEIEEQETHELIGYDKELENLQGVLDGLIRKLDVEFMGYIDKMKRGEKEDDADYDNFIEIVSSFVAKRIGRITHIADTYKLEKVDLIDKKLLTQGGKEIQLSDMGTGQSQSAYIDGILSMNDKRKIIALFDEVGMMDENSLEPIKKRLVNLFENNELYLGLIVQKDIEVNITELV